MPRRRRRILLLAAACLVLGSGYHRAHDGEAASSAGIDLSSSAARVLLLTAHPDDECMFFAPTVLHLVRHHSNDAALHALCLSVGNADGLGHIREKELRDSLRILGIPEGRSRVLNHPQLQDNITQHWSPEIIAETMRPYILSHDINFILTFDEHGVSQHPNHISLFHGAVRLLRSYLPPSTPSPSPRLFVLRTVSLPRKYTGPASALIACMFPLPFPFPFPFPWASYRRACTPPAYLTDLGSYATSLRAMYQHQSQLVWFRWLYVLFSRYMWVNEWAEIEVLRPDGWRYLECDAG